MNAPGIDPITKLFDAVKASDRMRGIEVLFGKRSAPLECSAPRIVMNPTGGPIEAPDHSGNQADVAVAVECECWGETFTQLWEVCRCLLDAVNDYGYTGDEPADTTADGVADCVRPEAVEIEFGESDDTNQQGWFAIVTINVVASFEYVPLSESTGHPDIVTIQPA